MMGGWVSKALEGLLILTFILWLMVMVISGSVVLWALFTIFSVCF